jgi:hypothetical protein
MQAGNTKVNTKIAHINKDGMQFIINRIAFRSFICSSI